MLWRIRTDVAVTLNNLGVLDCMYGQYAQAEPLLTRALGRPIQRSRRRWRNLANALRKLGHADEGVSLELRAKNFRAKRS